MHWTAPKGGATVAPMSGIALLMFAGVILLPVAFFFWIGWCALLVRDTHTSKGRPSLK
jgi:hypothetical protein